MIQHKKKVCKTCGTLQYIWSHGNCRRCDALNKPPQAIKPREPISKLSDNQKKLNAAYSVLAAQHKKNHPICQAMVKCQGAKATETHHMRGRGKKYMLDDKWFLSTCAACHKWIGENNTKATELGFSVSPSATEY